MNRLFNEIFPNVFLKIVEKYVERVNRIINEYDVVIFMARKAICFFDALVISGNIKKNKDCCIVSSRALDYNILDSFKGKKVAMIDDFVIKGASISRSLSLLKENEIIPDIYIAACEENFIKRVNDFDKRLIDKTYVELSYMDLCKIAEGITNFIAATMCPYNIDQPIYKIKFSTSDELCEFVGKNRCTDITSSFQKKHSIVNKVIHVDSGIFKDLFPCEVDLDKVYVKLRLMYKVNSSEMIVLPFVVLPEVDENVMDKLYQIVRTDDLDKMINKKEKRLENENKLNLFQYVFSNFLLMAFLRETNCLHIARKVKSNEMAQFAKCLYEDAFLQKDVGIRGIVSNEKFLNIGKFLYNTYIAYTYDLIYSKCESTDTYFYKEEKISDFITFDTLTEFIKSKEDALDKYAVSNLIDIFIDKGFLVPIILCGAENSVLRAYRFGEVAKLTREIMELFSYSLGQYLDNIGEKNSLDRKDYLDKTEYEKLCVVFFRRGTRIFGESEINDEEEEDYYGIAYSKFGPRVSQVSGKRYEVKRALADEMLDLELMKLERKSIQGNLVKKYVLKDTRKHFNNSAWKSYADIFAYDFYSIRKAYLSLVKKERKWDYLIPTYNRLLTLLAIGENEKEQMLSIVAEINLFYSINVKSNDLNIILKKAKIVFDGICSGIWKYLCYRNDILSKIFDGMGKEEVNVCRAKLDYVSLRINKSRQMNDFVDDCGSFLVCLAYTLSKLFEKYHIAFSKPRDFRYIYDKLYARELYCAEKRYEQPVSQGKDLDDILMLHREAGSLIDYCDIILEEEAVNIEKITKALIVYSPHYLEHENRSIRKNTGKNAERYKYEIIKCNNTWDYVSQLEDIVDEYHKQYEDNNLLIIVANMENWYEGVLYSSFTISGSYFDKLVGEIIEKTETQLSEGPYIDLVMCGENLIDLNGKIESRFSVHKSENFTFTYNNYKIRRYLLRRNEKVKIGNINSEKTFIADKIEVNMQNYFEWDSPEKINNLKKELNCILKNNGCNEMINATSQVLEVVDTKDESKIKKCLGELYNVGRTVITNVATPVIIEYLKYWNIIPRLP